MIVDGDVAATAWRLGVACDALALVKGLDGFVGDAHIDELTDQPKRDGVPAAIDLDMVVGGYSAALPDGESVGLGWEV